MRAARGPVVKGGTTVASDASAANDTTDKQREEASGVQGGGAVRMFKGRAEHDAPAALPTQDTGARDNTDARASGEAAAGAAAAPVAAEDGPRRGAAEDMLTAVPARDWVAEASEESFPASDAPAWYR